MKYFFLQKMKSSPLFSLFLLHSVHSLEEPLDGEDEGVRWIVIIIIYLSIIIIMCQCSL